MEASEPDRRPTRLPGPTVEQAKAFCAVANASSYAEAAERLNLKGHVTLVRLVSRFTRTLGLGRLIEQEAKGRVRLTATGRRVLPAAQGFIESARELTELRPEIRFSAYPTIAGRLAKRCPALLEHDVPLVLKNISEANRQDGGWRLVHDVAAGRLDMAIAPAHLREEHLVERFLYAWRLRVVFPEDGEGRDMAHPPRDPMQVSPKMQRLRQKKWVTPADIADFRIAVAPDGHRSRELLREAFAMADVDLKVALESPNQELLRAVALGGTQYVAVIPDDAFDLEDVRNAPYLHVKHEKKPFGGEYALYMRKREGAGEEPLVSEHDAAIAEAADQLVDAFRDD